jgi:hypothetical protein
MIEEVLMKAWTDPPFVKGNFARQHAHEVAAAASLGLITTEVTQGTFGVQWLITREGLAVLNG